MRAACPAEAPFKLEVLLIHLSAVAGCDRRRAAIAQGRCGAARISCHSRRWKPLPASRGYLPRGA
ncbi:hypothetical protein [Lysobacter gummosus]|uniref:hypothetical protein n=1 Tax=Lysobacter gummosus TaxID=262324 RepID=UPI00363E6966